MLPTGVVPDRARTGGSSAASAASHLTSSGPASADVIAGADVSDPDASVATADQAGPSGGRKDAPPSQASPDPVAEPMTKRSQSGGSCRHRAVDKRRPGHPVRVGAGSAGRPQAGPDEIGQVPPCEDARHPPPANAPPEAGKTAVAPRQPTSRPDALAPDPGVAALGDGRPWWDDKPFASTSPWQARSPERRIGTLNEPLIPQARLVETREFRPDPPPKDVRRVRKRPLGPRRTGEPI